MSENTSLNPQESQPSPEKLPVSRRGFLMTVGVALNALVGLALAAPIVAYVLGPATRRKDYLQWIPVGDIDDFPPGETRLVTFLDPFANPWDGVTAKIPAYVRCSATGQFTVFAVNCAHLGCPVRWFAESQLFMCPCHGGAYYADGSRASGPPERGLFVYEMKVENGKLMINAGQMPTLRTRASATPCSPPAADASSTQQLIRIKPCPGSNESTIG
jgi:Rieske Fe-S protein